MGTFYQISYRQFDHGSVRAQYTCSATILSSSELSCNHHGSCKIFCGGTMCFPLTQLLYVIRELKAGCWGLNHSPSSKHKYIVRVSMDCFRSLQPCSSGKGRCLRCLFSRTKGLCQG